MKNKFLIVVILGLASCIEPPASLTFAGVGFGKGYRAPAELTDWQGSMNLIPGSSDYLLTAFSPAPTNQPLLAATSVARIGNDGNIAWALSATAGLQGQITIKPNATQPIVFTKIEGLPDEDFWTVFGLFNARDGTRIFERGIPLILAKDSTLPNYFPEQSASVEYLSDGRCAVLWQDNDLRVNVAILDANGKPQWERSYQSAAFASGGGGAKVRLIEYPGKGFWLFVQGSHPISTDPNPPAVNTAVTLNLARLSDEGDIQWTTKLSGLLTGSSILPVGPVAIDNDGTLILPLSDVVIDTFGLPTLFGLSTYLVAIGPDANLRWAERIPRTGDVTPVFIQNTLFVFGQKLRALNAPTVTDAVILRLNSNTGASLAQTSVASSSVGGLSLSGALANRLYLQGITSSNSNLRALVGYLNLTLNVAVWKRLDAFPVASAALHVNPKSNSLLLSDMPKDDFRIDGIELDSDLNPLGADPALNGPPCPLVSAVTIPTANPQIVLEKLSLTPSYLPIGMQDVDLPLIPTTRIVLRSILPGVEELCPNPTSSAPQLTVRPDAVPGKLNLTFLSQMGTGYELLFAPNLSGQMEMLEKVVGNGQMVERSVAIVRDGNGFYALRTVQP